MNPYLTASLAVLEELYGNLTACVQPLSGECLNWSPPAPETNTIANLVCHIAGSVNSWFARALDEPYERDRDAEFRARRSAAELVALLTTSQQLAREQITRLDALDGGTVRHLRRLSSGKEMPLTVAWCVEHAVIHAGEHWGQIQLNRQWYELAQAAAQAR
jgi:uncharacterized damage-inducible protein DinB